MDPWPCPQPQPQRSDKLLDSTDPTRVISRFGSNNAILCADLTRRICRSAPRLHLTRKRKSRSLLSRFQRIVISL